MLTVKDFFRHKVPKLKSHEVFPTLSFVNTNNKRKKIQNRNRQTMKYHHTEVVKNSIYSLAKILDSYRKKSKKNLSLIHNLQKENNFLIEELARLCQKSSVYSKTTKQVFSNLVQRYRDKGYQIDYLNLNTNLFAKNPLIIETNHDVDDFYNLAPETKGKYIESLDDFQEINWKYLNKLDKLCEEAKKYNITRDAFIKQRLKDKFRKEIEKARNDKDSTKIDAQIRNIPKLKREIEVLKTTINSQNFDFKDDKFDSFALRRNHNNTISNFNSDKAKNSLFPKRTFSKFNDLGETIYSTKCKLNKRKYNTVKELFAETAKSNTPFVILTGVQERDEKNKFMNTENLYNKLNGENYKSMDEVRDIICQNDDAKLDYNGVESHINSHIKKAKKLTNSLNIQNKYAECFNDFKIKDLPKADTKNYEKLQAVDSKINSLDKIASKHRTDELFDMNRDNKTAKNNYYDAKYTVPHLKIGDD